MKLLTSVRESVGGTSDLQQNDGVDQYQEGHEELGLRSCGHTTIGWIAMLSACDVPCLRSPNASSKRFGAHWRAQVSAKKLATAAVCSTKLILCYIL